MLQRLNLWHEKYGSYVEQIEKVWWIILTLKLKRFKVKEVVYKRNLAKALLFLNSFCHLSSIQNLY